MYTRYLRESVEYIDTMVELADEPEYAPIATATRVSSDKASEHKDVEDESLIITTRIA